MPQVVLDAHLLSQAILNKLFLCAVSSLKWRLQLIFGIRLFFEGATAIGPCGYVNEK